MLCSKGLQKVRRFRGNEAWALEGSLELCWQELLAPGRFNQARLICWWVWLWTLPDIQPPGWGFGGVLTTLPCLKALVTETLRPYVPLGMIKMNVRVKSREMGLLATVKGLCCYSEISSSQSYGSIYSKDGILFFYKWTSNVEESNNSFIAQSCRKLIILSLVSFNFEFWVFLNGSCLTVTKKCFQAKIFK